MIAGEGVRLRRAEPGDVEFIVALLQHEEVEPFLAAMTPREPDEILAEVQRSLAEPEQLGRFVIEAEAGGEWLRAGLVGFELRNRRNRIAFLHRFALHPDFRGRGLGDAAARLLQRYLVFELDYHRLELEVYGFNERAIAHAERAGFVREGVKRKAYRRNDEWVDSVLFGLVREDLEEPTVE